MRKVLANDALQDGTESSDERTRQKYSQYLLPFSFGLASLLELESLEELGRPFDFKINRADNSAALIECDESCALKLIRRIGGSFTIARVLGHDIDDALAKVTLPFEPKFNWTVSGYQCSLQLLQETRHELHQLLREKGLGKSKFLEPS